MKMGMMAIPGLEGIASRLLRQVARRQLSHAYLFTGPRHREKLELARGLAKALNCASPDEHGDSCDRCAHCRRIDHGNFLDFQVVEPEGESMKIDQIRSLKQFLAVRSHEAEWKVYVLCGAESLTVQAANSLLKMIEEPPSPSVAILLAGHRGQLLPTVASRCQEVAFPPLSPQELAEQLQQSGIQPAYARILSRLEVEPEQAKTFVEGEGFAEALNLVIQWGEEVIRHPVKAIRTLQALFQLGRDKWVLGLLILWLRDLLLVQLQQEEELAFVERRSQLVQQAGQWPQEKLLFFLERFFGLQRQKKMNLNLQLAVEEIIFSSWQK
jgi:DNA polymerase-3 subunit delta'